MNPHADSVQQEAEEYAAFKDWRWKTSSVDPWDAWKARAALARFGTRPAAEPLTETYVQPVPDHCDRITWRNRYYSLPIAAEPSQSGSAGEAGQPWTMEVVAQLAGYPARAAEPSNLLLAAAVEALEFAEDHSDVADGPDGQPQANRAMLLAETLRAALSRQAPAAVDFEQWWLAEVAANGGVPIGADYKHWAKAGFELRGDARAPAAPAEAERVYLVATGETVGGLETYTRHKGAPPPLSDYERLYTAPTPADPQALLGWTRYEKARKLNVAQWAELHQRNLRGENFDDMIDALPATTQPGQQDTCIDDASFALAQTMAAPQAPSGQQAEPTELLRAMVGWYSTHGTLHHSDVMGKAKAFLAGQHSERPSGPPWHFRRFVKGQEMAEDIQIERATTMEDAIREAIRLCPYRERTVLVLSPSERPAGQAVAWVPVHPREGPLWAMTTDKPDPERLPSYPRRALAFVAASQAERPAVMEDGNAQ